MKLRTFPASILLLTLVAAACDSPRPESSTPSPTAIASVAAIVSTAAPTPAPTLAPSLSPNEAIARVQNFIRGEAQTTDARLRVSRMYDAKWEAVYVGNGMWEVRGAGNWRLFESDKLVQPTDEAALAFLRGIDTANVAPTSPASTPLPAPAPAPAPTASSASELIAALRPSVVKIKTSTGMGSGVLIDQAGYILTNNHVIEGETTVKVTVQDQWTVSGQVLGRDEVADLAVVKIEGRDFKVARLGDSSRVAPGDEVVAIGYPLDLPGAATVTKGIVSAVRPMGSPGNVRLQTDTAINPGNSGGPLYNMDGEVVGINVSGIEQVEGRIIQGMKFAVAINTAKSVLPQLKAGQSILKAATASPPNTAVPARTSAPTAEAPATGETKYVNKSYWYSLVVPPTWQYEEISPEKTVIWDKQSGAIIAVSVQLHDRVMYPDFDIYNKSMEPLLGEGQTSLTTGTKTKIWAGKPVEGYEIPFMFNDKSGQAWRAVARSFILGDIRFWVTAQSLSTDWPRLEVTLRNALNSLRTDTYTSEAHLYSVSFPTDWSVVASDPNSMVLISSQGNLFVQIDVQAALRTAYPTRDAYMARWTVKVPEDSTNVTIGPKVRTRNREKVPAYGIDYSYTSSAGKRKARAVILLAREKAFWLFINASDSDWPQLEPAIRAVEERFSVAP